MSFNRFTSCLSVEVVVTVAAGGFSLFWLVDMVTVGVTLRCRTLRLGACLRHHAPMYSHQRLGVVSFLYHEYLREQEYLISGCGLAWLGCVATFVAMDTGLTSGVSSIFRGHRWRKEWLAQQMPEYPTQYQLFLLHWVDLAQGDLQIMCSI